MHSLRLNFLRRVALAALVLAAALPAFAAPLFVAHPGVAQAGVTADEIESLLTGKLTKWRDGASVTLVLLADGPVHDEVCKTFAKRSPDQLEKHWKKLVFTGKGRAPVVAKTEAELADLVAKTPGALGYVAPGAAGGAKPLALE